MPSHRITMKLLLSSTLLAVALVSLSGVSGNRMARGPREPRQESERPPRELRDDESAFHWELVAGAAKESTLYVPGVERVHWIKAVEMEWDYTPEHVNTARGGRDFNEDEDVFVGRTEQLVGSKYIKCLYRAYTEDFGEALPHTSQLMQGPVIHAEVDDTVTVHFKNECSFPATVHVHGFSYTKDSEGIPSAENGFSGVKPGETKTYSYDVPTQAGPGPAEGSSTVWMYHSHVDEVADLYSGLMGPIVVTAKGMARDDGSPRDVDQEVFSLWMVMDENSSHLLDKNVEKLHAEFPEAADAEVDMDTFEESNLMHMMNGFLYGNGPMITMCASSRVRWYNMGMGNEVDLHTPHWHGNTILSNGRRSDVINLLPATMIVTDMYPVNEGTWMYHCHVFDHIQAGMISQYKVNSCQS